jgi:hypothetical protein
MFKFFPKYRLRSAGKYILWLLLISTCVTSFLNFLKPTPNNMGVDNLTRYSFRLASTAEAFTREYLTFFKDDETFQYRVKPFLSKNVDPMTLVDVNKLTGSQTVINTWVNSTTGLVDNIYIVKVGASVETVSGNEKSRRNVVLGVPLEMTSTGSVLINGSPSLLPPIDSEQTKGLNLGMAVSNADAEIGNTIKNFMMKLTTDANHEDLRNFIDGSFDIIPMNKFVSFVGVENVQVYSDLSVSTAVVGLTYYVVTAKITLKDAKTGMIFVPDYMFKMYGKDGKYYIKSMNYQPYAR